METKQRYSLGKAERLKSRKQIDLLFNKGKTFSVFPYRIFWMPANGSDTALQAGFTVSGRQFKNAVDRNRIKRLMRECYRLQKSELMLKLKNNQKQLSVFFIYVGNELPEYDVLFQKTAHVLTRLIKLTDENNPPNT